VVDAAPVFECGLARGQSTLCIRSPSPSVTRSPIDVAVSTTAPAARFTRATGPLLPPSEPPPALDPPLDAAPRDDRFAEDFFADERFADERFAEDFFADDRFAEDFFAEDFFALLFFADERFAPPFFADARLAEDFFAEDFFAEDFFADDFFAPPFFAAAAPRPVLRRAMPLRRDVPLLPEDFDRVAIKTLLVRKCALRVCKN
jgi:hypothetical protein